MAKVIAPTAATSAQITAGETAVANASIAAVPDAASAAQITAGGAAIGGLSTPTDEEAAEAAYNAMVAVDVAGDDAAEAAYNAMIAVGVSTTDPETLLRVLVQTRPLRPEQVEAIRGILAEIA